MDVDQGKGMSRGKKGRFRTGKGKHREKARERAKGDVPDHVFCVKDHTGLVTVLHIMVERANVLYHLAKDTRTLHRFDKLIWKVTDVTGSQLQVPLQFGSHLCRILQALIFKESSFSILEPRCPWEVLIFCKNFKRFTQMLDFS